MQAIVDQRLEAVSLRDVAAEVGVSMGIMQHYFRNNDRMLLFVVVGSGDRIT